MVIDGRLMMPAGKPPLPLTDLPYSKTEIADHDTTLKLTADNEWLYIAFDCAHLDPAGMRAKVLRNNTGGVFGDECVKVFISPANNPGSISGLC